MDQPWNSMEKMVVVEREPQVERKNLVTRPFLSHEYKVFRTLSISQPSSIFVPLSNFCCLGDLRILII